MGVNTKPRKLTEIIWSEQSALMDLYLNKGSLPSYPLDLKAKASQKVLREILYFFLEEWAEAIEAYETEVHTKVSEEFADTIHFWFELLIFVFDDYNEFQTLFHKTCRFSKPKDPILACFGLKSSETESTMNDLIAEISEVILIEKVDLFDFENSTWDFAWLITSLSLLSMNKLKAKPWRDGNSGQDLEVFKERLCITTAVFITTLSFYHYTSAENLLQSYLDKNTINKKRIEEKY